MCKGHFVRNTLQDSLLCDVVVEITTVTCMYYSTSLAIRKLSPSHNVIGHYVMHYIIAIEYSS